MVLYALFLELLDFSPTLQFISPVFKEYNLTFPNESIIDHVPWQCTQGKFRCLVFSWFQRIKKEKEERTEGKVVEKEKGDRKEKKQKITPLHLV